MLVAPSPRPCLSFATFFFETPSSFCRRRVAACFSFEEMPPEPPCEGAALWVATFLLGSPPPPHPPSPAAAAKAIRRAARQRGSGSGIGRPLGDPVVLLEVHELAAHVPRRLVLHPAPAL